MKVYVVVMVAVDVAVPPDWLVLKRGPDWGAPKRVRLSKLQ